VSTVPTLRRIAVGPTVAVAAAAAVLAAAVLAAPTGAGAGPLAFTGIGRSTAAPVATAPVGAPAVRAAGALAVTGSVAGLYPGVTLPLPLTVTNRSAKQVTVTSLTTSVANASKQCKRANLTVSPFTGAAVVAAGGSALVTVQATMALQAGDACQGAVFVLTYHGKALAR
jgi:hypothetical protein